MSKCRAPGGRRFSLARKFNICDFELDSRFSDPQRVPHPLRHLSIFRLLRLPDTSIRTPFLRGLRRNNSPGSRIPLAGLPCCGAADCSGCFRLPQHAHPQTRAQAHSTERAAFARKRSGYCASTHCARSDRRGRTANSRRTFRETRQAWPRPRDSSADANRTDGTKQQTKLDRKNKWRAMMKRQDRQPRHDHFFSGPGLVFATFGPLAFSYCFVDRSESAASKPRVPGCQTRRRTKKSGSLKRGSDSKRSWSSRPSSVAGRGKKLHVAV